METPHTAYRDTVADRRPSRRSIVAAGAWTVPAIAVTMASPAYAVSTTGSIRFAQPPEPVSACGISSSAVIQVTANGTSAAGAGVPVAVALADGLAWADGGTGTRDLITDAAGRVALDGRNAVRGGGAAGEYEITALAPTVATLPATATLRVTTSVGSFYIWRPKSDVPALVGGVEGIVEQVALGEYTIVGRTTDGSVYIADPTATTPVAKKVTGLSGPATWIDQWYGNGWTAIAAGGRAWVVSSGTAAQPAAQIPTDVTIVRVSIGTYGVLSMADNGDLWFFNPNALTGAAVQMTGLPQGGATDIEVYPGGGQWSVAAGADGTAYLATPASHPKYHPIAGVIGKAVQVRIGVYGMLIRDDLGKVYFGNPNANQKGGGFVTEVPGLGAPATDIDNYDDGGVWSVAVAGGEGYVRQHGSVGYIKIPGATDLKKIVIGQYGVSASDKNGDLWFANPNDKAPTFVPVTRVGTAVDIDPYWGGGRWLAMAVAPTC